MDTDEIIRSLQSRIDKCGFQISEDILYSDWNHPALKACKKSVEERQALDKRIMGELISLRQQAKWYSENV